MISTYAMHASLHLGPLTLTFLRLKAPRRPGWATWQWAGGSLIVRFGCLILNWWKR